MGGTYSDVRPVFEGVPESADEMPIGIDLRRAACGKPIIAVCLSDRVVGLPTHYYRGRTSPCGRESCAACEDQSPLRWLGYLACFDDGSQKPFMVELTLSAARQLTRDFIELRSMRGHWIEVARAGKRPNGRVCAQRLARNPRSSALVQCPDLPRILMHMWRCPDRQLHLLDDRVPQEPAPAVDALGRKMA